MNKFYSFWFRKYQDESYEIQKKMSYLFFFAIITLLIIISLALYSIFFGIFNSWQLWADIIGSIGLIMILIFIKRGHPKKAVYTFIIVITLFTWHFIFQDWISDRIRTLSRLNEMITLILVSIMLLGLFATQRRQIIIHTIIGNILVITHFIILMHKYYPEGDSEAFWHIFLGLVTINTCFIGSILIYTLSHNLMKLLIIADKEKIDALTQVVDEFIPICSNCKAIRQDDDNWKTIEDYITDKSKSVKISHGLCPTCAKKLYPFLEEKPDK